NGLLQLGLWSILGGLIGSAAAPFFARRVGKKKACVVVCFLAIFINTVPIALRLLGFMPANGSPWVLRILILDTIVGGLLGVTAYAIATSMFADIVEEVQLQTKRRSEGLLMAAESLAIKLASSASVGIPGLLIEAVHFPRFAKPGHVDIALLNRLALLYLPLATMI